MKLPKKGNRVRIKSLNSKGKIVYIDTPALYVDHYFPIQVKLDKPYDESGQTLYRTNLKDMVYLKKKKTEPVKKKKKKKVSFDEEVFSF